MEKRIYLSSPHMGGEEACFFEDAFRSNWIAPLGPHVDAFEREFAELLGTGGAVALSSGTAAIHLGLRLLGVGPGDTVFCSSNTFVATANPIVYLGAEPVFIDSDPGTWNMAAGALRRAFRDADRQGRLPKAVVVVDLYGQSADMDTLRVVCERYGVPILEDAAEALGATYHGKSCGTLARLGVFSFNGNKIITTSGGGALVSNDLEALEKVRFWSTQARDPAPHYEHTEIGYNYRLSNLLAAVGRGQLRVLGQRVDARREVFRRYQEALGDVPGIEFMPEAPYGRSTRWLTALTVTPSMCGVTASDIVDSLARHSIEARPVWKPLHLQPVYKQARYYPYSESRSVSQQLFETGLCLPSGSNLTDEDIARVISGVRECLRVPRSYAIPPRIPERVLPAYAGAASPSGNDGSPKVEDEQYVSA